MNRFIEILFLILFCITSISNVESQSENETIAYETRLTFLKNLKDSTFIDTFEIVNRKINGVNSISDTIYFKINTMPLFPGGEIELMNFLAKNIIFPPNARDESIEGKVYIGFIVNKDGSISDVKIEKSLTKELDKICINAVTKMPDWIPGIKYGRPQNVYVLLPINITLE
ncbi:energy transducer TonB [Saccharicrinis sp. FJH62]|uniref:energy transducer TonB n=1 Tax=Saccharicrinis sp. FJH62 TaxID=3344657 RepID=UPI0035D4A4A0